MSALHGDPQASIDFLHLWAPTGRWVITAIKPEQSGLESETFGPGEEVALAKWVEDRNGKDNLYFGVNPLLRPMSGKGAKAKKTDVRGMAWLHTDLDPAPRDPSSPLTVEEHHAKERETALAKAHAFDPPPTVIIDSGGGYQAFWKLDEEQPINGDEARAIELEGYNYELEVVLGADKVHNLDRVMRLVGTINVPNEKKRAKGRKPALACLVEYHQERVYPITAFKHRPTPDDKRSASVVVKLSPNRAPPAKVDALLDTLDAKTRMLFVQGGDPDDPAKWADRSKLVWHGTCTCIRKDWDNDQIAAVMLNKDFGISAHVLAQPRPERYLARQITRARDAVAAEDQEFRKNEDGKIIPNVRHNILKALKVLGVSLTYDEFADRLLISGLPGAGPQLDDAAVVRLWLTLDDDKRLGFRPSRDYFDAVIFDLARLNGFHPVRDYLSNLTWDGKPRIDAWLPTYCGSKDTDYTRAVGAIWLMAAVRRVRDPGCKFDEMLVFESGQGKEKSTAFAILAVKQEWFSDSLPLDAKNREAVEQLLGKWIVEAAELNGMKHGDVEHLKSFMSRQVDRARMAFHRMITDRPRQNVFAGTTNAEKYLRDKTGNRRFWPVGTPWFDLPGLRRDRDQLWAEAAAREAMGESIRLDPSLFGAAAVEQEGRTVDDPYQIQLESVLGDLKGKIRSVDVFRITGLAYGGRPDQTLNQRVGEAMTALGWEHCRLRFGGAAEGAYVRGEKWERGNSIALRIDEGGNGRLPELRAFLAPDSLKADPQAAQSVLMLGDAAPVEEKPPF